MRKKILFSVTAKDCVFDYIRGSGKGGQKRNKTSSAVRCRHLPSKAVGYSEETRSQHKNKRSAFGKMARSKEMQNWLRLDGARREGVTMEIEMWVDKEMSKIKIEEKQDGKWVAQ